MIKIEPTQHQGSVEDIGNQYAQAIFDRLSPATRSDLIINSARDQMKLVLRYYPDAPVRVVQHAAAGLFELGGEHNYQAARAQGEDELGDNLDMFARYKSWLVFRATERPDDDYETNGRGLNHFRRFRKPE